VKSRLINSIIAATVVSGYLHFGKSSGEKMPRKCRLKDCQRTTTHNGGFCCAEHKFKQDKQDKQKGTK